jgi:hypothetical protein
MENKNTPLKRLLPSDILEYENIGLRQAQKRIVQVKEKLNIPKENFITREDYEKAFFGHRRKDD